MIRAAVLGSPISHSLSPTLHNRAYEILGISGKYEAIELSEVEFPQFFAEATALDASVDWRGFSLTMPLKEIVTNSLIGVDPLAKRISSANTILIDRNSQEVNVKILSTDVLGFRTIFDRITINQDSSVAIIGGGGTARAAVSALDGLVSNINVYQRSEKRNNLVRGAASLSAINFHGLNKLNDVLDHSLIVSTLPNTASEVLIAAIPPKGFLLKTSAQLTPSSLIEKKSKDRASYTTEIPLKLEVAFFAFIPKAKPISSKTQPPIQKRPQ